MPPLRSLQVQEHVMYETKQHSDTITVALPTLIQQERWFEVLQKLTTNPDEARKKFRVKLFTRGTTCHLLHLVCRKKRAPVEIFMVLLALNPHAASTKDSFSQSLPLHVALQSQIAWDKLDYLIRSCPRSLVIPDKEGNLPLHLACSFAPTETVMAILDTEPNAASQVNSKTQTPLHLACNRYDISDQVVTALLQESSSATEQPDWQDQLPIHKAITWKAPISVVNTLLLAYPAGIRKVDKKGLTPYSLARKVIGMTSEDEVLQELHRYRSKVGGIFLRSQDKFHFAVERILDKRRRTNSIV